MMESDRELLDAIHLNIHALRLIPKYKPSEFEFKVSKMIAEKYAGRCKECREKFEQYKNAKPVEKKAGFMGRLNHALEETDTQ